MKTLIFFKYAWDIQMRLPLDLNQIWYIFGIIFEKKMLFVGLHLFFLLFK